MESITLYSTHCPRCQVLEKKLEKAGKLGQETIDFSDNTQVQKNLEKVKKWGQEMNDFSDTQLTEIGESAFETIDEFSWLLRRQYYTVPGRETDKIT